MKKEGNGTKFYGETNLPNGTKLGISLEKEGKLCGQDFDILVNEGKFCSSAFTGYGAPLVGEYEVILFTYFNKSWHKDSELLEELLSYGGPCIIDDEKLEVRKKFILGENLSAEEIEQKKLLDQKKTKEISLLRMHLNQLTDMKNELNEAAKNPHDFVGLWSVNWNKRRDAMDNEYSKQFGRSQNEYKGYCARAHLFIGIGYYELFQLWSRYNEYIQGRGSKDRVLKKQKELEKSIQGADRELEKCMP
jgi:hypothetical protein